MFTRFEINNEGPFKTIQLPFMVVEKIHIDKNDFLLLHYDSLSTS